MCIKMTNAMSMKKQRNTCKNNELLAKGEKHMLCSCLPDIVIVSTVLIGPHYKIRLSCLHQNKIT